MLNGYRCTIHWENLASFSENFPEIEATSELFEVDRNRFTCSGGTAALDMMLNMISQQHGHELAASVSEQFIHERIRDRHDHQRMALTARLGVRHPKLIQVIQLMEQNLEEPLSRQELAEAAGLSSRQWSGCSPSICTARRRAITWSCASTARGCCCCRPICR